MGEYLKVNGKEIKLGTCESLYYVRLSDLQEIEALGIAKKIDGNDELAGYLDPANGYHYRFPFPEEDHTPAGEYENYDKGFSLVVDPKIAPQLYGYLHGEEWEHGTICHSCNVGGGSYNVNIILPCPLSHDFPKDIKMSTGGASSVIEITQQKQVEGKIWTVIRCGYCKAAIRLDVEGGTELAACLNAYADNMARYKDNESTVEYYREVARRVLQGYK
jgi:hypothetical protein